MTLLDTIPKNGRGIGHDNQENMKYQDSLLPPGEKTQMME